MYHSPVLAEYTPSIRMCARADIMIGILYRRWKRYSDTNLKSEILADFGWGEVWSLNSGDMPYFFNSITCCPQIVAAQALSEINAALDSICGTQTCVQICVADVHQTSARAICVLWLVSADDSRTERLHVLLTASIRPSYITCTYL